MIFLRVLPKIFLWPTTRGPQELGGPGSLNRLNPRFLRHWPRGSSYRRWRNHHSWRRPVMRYNSLMRSSQDMACQRSTAGDRLPLRSDINSYCSQFVSRQGTHPVWLEKPPPTRQRRPSGLTHGSLHAAVVYQSPAVDLTFPCSCLGVCG